MVKQSPQAGFGSLSHPIDWVEISDEMISDVLAFLCRYGFFDSDSGLSVLAAEGPDRVWAVELIRAVLDSASKELRSKETLIPARRQVPQKGSSASLSQ